MEEPNGQPVSENKNPSRPIWPILLLLLLFFFALFFFWSRIVSKPRPTGNSINQGKPPVASKEINYADQEKRDVVLNFYAKQVILSGYPYINKKVKPSFYNLIYIDTIVDDEKEFPTKLTDPLGNWAPKPDQSGLWSGMYESSRSKSRIFIPIGRSVADAPIWQTMEIVTKSSTETTLNGCAPTSYPLLENLVALNYSCQVTPENKEFAGSPPCYVPVTETEGILYRQYSSDGSAKDNMCEVMKSNSIFSISFKPNN